MSCQNKPQNKQGHVTLLGAGPGDADLLTLKAVKALQAADVVLFDHLVSEEVLAFVRQGAKKLLVGKRARRKSCKQDDINALMVKWAKAGRHVVRLKSGDPMIFGRANEEIDVLRLAGISVSVVPGITSASAFAARLCTSLTERVTARSVRYVTGHALSGDLPEDLDWQGLSDPSTTLMIYMGGHTAGEMAMRLMAHGLAPTTPVILASNVSRADETLTYLRLDQLENGPAINRHPVLIGIGQVFDAVVARALNQEGVEGYAASC